MKMRILHELDWVASLEDIDHDIVDIAEHAKLVIQMQQRTIENLAGQIKQHQKAEYVKRLRKSTQTS